MMSAEGAPMAETAGGLVKRSSTYDPDVLALAGCLPTHPTCRPAKLGLLSVFCDRTPDGLYVRNRYPHEGHPYRVLNREQLVERRECGW